MVSEGAAVIRLWRDVDRPHPPAVDPHKAEGANTSARIPSGAVDDLRARAKRARRGRDDEMLVGRLARPDYPMAPGMRACSDPARTDDPEPATAYHSGGRQARWHT